LIARRAANEKKANAARQQEEMNILQRKGVGNK